MKAPTRVLLTLLLLFLDMHVMAAANDKRDFEASSAVVTLDVFSGRPNPAWSLSEPMTAEFLRRLKALDASKVDGPEFDGLGYRAVRAVFQDQAEGVIVTASRGIVTLEQASQRFHYADAGRQFELWLVNTGAGHVSSDVLQYVTREIGSKPQ